MSTIQNPILKGFNPDPSIVRVGDDYYIATSTFEWFPGVQIHHSKDLINWELVGHVLTDKSQLDMRGNPDSCGVWAPCLSHHEGTFYLVFSNVRTFDGVWKDTPNYLVTSNDIQGEWSKPIFLNSYGFDGSIFHDEDGRKYFLSMLVDHRGGKFFGGIVMQEYDVVQEKLVGKMKHIYVGTDLGLTEGPHIYRKNGYYYLLTAEGGTEYGHAVSIARSKDLWGSYEDHPQNPLISSREDSGNYLQKSGHGDLFETHTGEWYAVFLVGRPLTTHGRCVLGRETAIEKIEWKEDGWPYAVSGSCIPRKEVEGLLDDVTELEKTIFEADDFEGEKLSVHYASLRVPITEDWASLKQRDSFLRMIGRESLSSMHDQSLIARRIQNKHITCNTTIEFEPESFQQMAGLVCYYNTTHFHYLCITSDLEGEKKYLNIFSADKFVIKEPLDQLVDITGNKRIVLKVDFNGKELQFYYAVEEGCWTKIGPVLDGSILSDDYIQSDGTGRYRPAFTGSFVGICCQDLSGNSKHADFDSFHYQEIVLDEASVQAVTF